MLFVQKRTLQAKFKKFLIRLNVALENDEKLMAYEIVDKTD
jgi:hypothetical protein